MDLLRAVNLRCQNMLNYGDLIIKAPKESKNFKLFILGQKIKEKDKAVLK